MLWVEFFLKLFLSKFQNGYVPFKSGLIFACWQGKKNTFKLGSSLIKGWVKFNNLISFFVIIFFRYFRKFTLVREKSSKMEDVLLRFGHIGLEIFLSLDIQSLTKCQEASRSWKTFIDNEKIAPFKIINEKTNIPTKNVWKAIRESSLESAIQLANEVNFVYNTPLRYEIICPKMWGLR